MISLPYSRRSLLRAFAVLLVLVACSAPPTTADVFKIAVIVDTATDPVSREQVEGVLAIANESLLELTGFGFQMIDFVEDENGGSIERMATDYMEHARELPNGILIFSVGDDDHAKINRAYAQQIPAPDGYRNAFVSPYPHLGDGHMYIAVLQFNHLYAACGYAGTDTIQSPVSSGDECRGVEGEACVEWNGMQICPIALPYLEGRIPIDLAAGPVVHEFMHPFGLRGPDDHYGTEACNLAMGWQPDHFDYEEGEYYDGMCPDVFAAFAASYQP